MLELCLTEWECRKSKHDRAFGISCQSAMSVPCVKSPVRLTSVAPPPVAADADAAGGRAAAAAPGPGHVCRRRQLAGPRVHGRRRVGELLRSALWREAHCAPCLHDGLHSDQAGLGPRAGLASAPVGCLPAAGVPTGVLFG